MEARSVPPSPICWLRAVTGASIPPGDAGPEISIALEPQDAVKSRKIIPQQSLMRSGPLEVGIPYRICLWKGMAVILDAYEELSRRILVPGEEDGVPDNLDEEAKRLVDPPDEAQETTYGARAREEIDLLGLEILVLRQEVTLVLLSLRGSSSGVQAGGAPILSDTLADGNEAREDNARNQYGRLITVQPAE
ncbi:MAG: hypothetical protein Q9188_003182 [Gyalolechia gomerana]